MLVSCRLGLIMVLLSCLCTCRDATNQIITPPWLIYFFFSLGTKLEACVGLGVLQSVGTITGPEGWKLARKVRRAAGVSNAPSLLRIVLSRPALTLHAVLRVAYTFERRCRGHQDEASMCRGRNGRYSGSCESPLHRPSLCLLGRGCLQAGRTSGRMKRPGSFLTAECSPIPLCLLTRGQDPTC